MNKKLLISSLFTMGVLVGMPAWAQDQVVKLTTAKAVGETITLRTNQLRQGVTVDWGNGTPQTYAATDGNYLVIEGTVQGETITLTASKRLTTLIAEGNELTAIDVSGAANLRSLYCQNNKLTSLDVTALSNLTDLNCANNSIEKMTIASAKNPLLENVSLAGNGMKNATSGSSNKFELAHNNLQQLDIADNQFTVMNLTKNRQLDFLRCSNNAFSSKLNLAQNDSLTTLVANGNDITSITLPSVNGMPALQQVVLDDNDLSTLDFTLSSKLHTLYCTNNQLTMVGLPAKVKLYAMACDNNKLTFSSLPPSTTMPEHITYANQDETADITSALSQKNGKYYFELCPSWDERLNAAYLLDLSDWLIDANGRRTITLKWYGNKYGEEPAELTKATTSNREGDYFPLTSTSNYGKFSFLQPHDEVFCTMECSAYPELKFKSTIFSVYDTTNGISSVTASSDTDLKWNTDKGCLTFSASATIPVRVYTTAGQLIWQGNASSAATSLTLPSGVYIVNGQKVTL